MEETKISQMKTVQSVLRACAILECLASGHSKLTDIADHLKLSYGTTYRLLKTMETTGMVTQGKRERCYYLGSIFAKIGTAPVILHQNMIIHATEEMERLWKLSRETVALFILVRKQRIFLKEVQSNYELRFVMEQIPIPIYPDPGGIGKTLLSLLSDAELDSIMIDSELIMHQTPFEKAEQVKSEVKQIQKDRFFIGSKKGIPGAISVSSPINNYIYPAVISIIGPACRMLPNAEIYLTEVKKSAILISST